MSKLLLLIPVLFMAVAASAKADDANLARLTEHAIACVNANAPQAERATPSLTDATQFLVEYLCASEIATRDLYLQNSRLVAVWRGTAAVITRSTPREEIDKREEERRQAYARVRVDAETGEIIWPEDYDGHAEMNAASDITKLIASKDPPAEIRAAAARAILGARLARLRSEGHL